MSVKHSHLPDSSTFDVFVGKGDSQWLFTVYVDVITQRSKLFSVAREQSERWYEYNKARMLVDEDPQVFSAYLDAIYFGVQPVGEKTASDVKVAIFLTDIHLLADKLRDPITANLVVDQLLIVIDRSEEVVAEIAIRIYASAKSDSPLRRLLHDIDAHNRERAWAEEDAEEASKLPYNAPEVVADGMSRMQVDTASRLDHLKGLYHRETERYEIDGAWTKAKGVMAFRQPDADDGD